MTLLLGSILCCIIALFVIRLLRKWLHPLEIVTYWPFIASTQLLLYTLFSLNLGFVELNDKITAILSAKQTAIIVIPVFIMSYLAILNIKKTHNITKILFFILFDLLMTVRDFIFWKSGVLFFIHWTVILSFILYAGLLLLAMAYRMLLHYLMRREIGHT